MQQDSIGGAFSREMHDVLRPRCGMQAGLGASPAFRVPEYQLQSTFELPLVLVLGALCGFVAAAFRVSTQVKPHP